MIGCTVGVDVGATVGTRVGSVPTPASVLGAVEWWHSAVGYSFATGVSQQLGVLRRTPRVQANTANQPDWTKSDADMGGRPSLDFDATDGLVANVSENWSGGITLFSEVYVPAAGTLRELFTAYTNGSSNGRVVAGTNTDLARAFLFSDTGAAQAFSAAQNIAGQHLWYILRVPQTGNAEIITPLGSASAAVPAGGLTTMNRISSGAATGFSSGFKQGDMAVFKSALPDSEIAKLRAYGNSLIL